MKTNNRRETYKKVFGTHCITQSLIEVMLNTINLFDEDMLTEPMFFGLDASLDFVYKLMGMGHIPHVFIGGRRTTWLDEFPKVTGIQIQRNEVQDKKEAWENLKAKLDCGIPVVLEVDKYQIGYWRKIIGPEDYGGHLIVAVDYDEEGVYISDQCRSDEKFMKVTFLELEDARSNKLFWKAPDNAYFSFTFPEKLPDKKEMIQRAIQINSHSMINGSIEDAKNGLGAYQDFMDSLNTWEDILDYQMASPKTGELINALDYELFKIKKLVHEGNIGGGGNFRYLYAKFLINAAGMTGISEYKTLAKQFMISAEKWKEIAQIISANEEYEFYYRNKTVLLKKMHSQVNEIRKIEEQAFRQLQELSRNNR